MSEISIEHRPPQARLRALGIADWPIWTKEVSVFAWHYDESETCYLLEGKVILTPATGEPVRFGAGDLVSFPAGLDCTWDVRVPVRKHYRFG